MKKIIYVLVAIFLLIGLVGVTGCTKSELTKSELRPGSGEVKLLVFLSPQYAGNEEIIRAIKGYSDAVKADLGWNTELIPLTDSSNTIGHIREVIRTEYTSYRIYAAMMVGEDIATALSADIPGIDAPSILLWSELDEPITYCQSLSPGTAHSVFHQISPEINKEELNSLLKTPGAIAAPPVHTPEVCISLIYPTAERAYSEKVTEIVYAFNKFSQRNLDYGGKILFLFDPESSSIGKYPELFREKWNRLGEVELITQFALEMNPPPVILFPPPVQPRKIIDGEKFKLLGADGHGAPGGVEGFSTNSLVRVSTPMAIFGSCYASGWHSDGEDNERLDPSKINPHGGWWGEQIFLHPDLRVVIAGTSPFARSPYYDRFTEAFAWYATNALTEGKTVAEAWINTVPLIFNADAQIVFGDPTFHY